VLPIVCGRLRTQMLTKHTQGKHYIQKCQTDTKYVVFVVNSMVMTTFLEAGYWTWRENTTNSVFGQFKGHNSGVPGGIGRL